MIQQPNLFDLEDADSGANMQSGVQFVSIESKKQQRLANAKSGYETLGYEGSKGVEGV